MRLTSDEHQKIKTWAQKHDHHAVVYLYGSRADDARRGGDIDLLVVSESAQKFKDKTSLLLELYDLIGEQKIDLSIRTPATLEKDAFFQEVLPKAIEL